MNSHLPVGRLAAYLEALSREQIWLAIVVTTALIAFADYMLPAIAAAPLYIPVICAACWGLGAREGYFVAITTASLAVVPSLRSGIALAPMMIALRVAVCILVFLFMAAVITSFRRSYDRELFHAHRDRMTGTLNKEVFQQRSARAIEDARHTGQTLLLAILDLDNFAAVNNHEGHLAGDDVLRSFAKGVSVIMRREDLIGRIGGDEFALLVRVPSIVEGQGFASDIHARLSEVLAHASIPVTCSMGALLIPPGAKRDPIALMHAADQAMYRAKRNGKNGIAIERAGEEESAAIVPIAKAKPREGMV